MEIFTIETDDVNKRVDVFLNEEMEDVSRSALQKNIEKGNITVNGEKISKNYKLRLGDIVEAELPPPENIDIVPEDIPLASLEYLPAKGSPFPQFSTVFLL